MRGTTSGWAWKRPIRLHGHRGRCVVGVMGVGVEAAVVAVVAAAKDA